MKRSDPAEAGPRADPAAKQVDTTSVAQSGDRNGERGPLRRLLDETIEKEGGSLKNLTVLAPQNDPFRIETDAGHRDGEWLAINAERLIGRRPIHLRGLHYALVTDQTVKPNGEVYGNTDKNWTWLQEKAADAARWLGYIPFDRIIDQRNAAPDVRVFTAPTTRAYVSIGVEVDIPSADDIEPFVGAYHVTEPGKTLSGFGTAQPYKLVLVGEKSSLGDVLGPIASAYEADLYLPTGCMSDTLYHRMARTGAEDGRPMAVFYFADCDPAGWNMAIEAARKLQALKTLLFNDLDFEVYRVALTPDQVREYGLPSTPLKDTELRGDKWTAAMGVQQTEIDALASLQPDLLRRIARDALGPFYDYTLGERARRAYSEWRSEAQATVDDAMDADRMERLREEAGRKLAELREEIDAINEALRVDADDFELPEIDVPEPVLRDLDLAPEPLVDSRWPFAEQCQRLIDSRAYAVGADR